VRARRPPRPVERLAAIGATRRGSRRIPGRRHGWRRARRLRSAHESTCGFCRWQGAFSGQGYGAFSLPLRDSARGSRPRRGRGGAGRSNAAAASYARGKGPRSNLALGIDTHACWGARWHGASGPRGDAREREHECKRERLGAAPRTRAARHDVQHDKGRLGQESGRTSMKAAAPANGLSQPGTKAGITSGGAAPQSNNAFHLGLKAGASTLGGKRSSSPGWPRAVVQASV
jgi:hypothetical protein